MAIPLWLLEEIATRSTGESEPLGGLITVTVDDAPIRGIKVSFAKRLGEGEYDEPMIWALHQDP